MSRGPDPPTLLSLWEIHVKRTDAPRRTTITLPKPADRAARLTITGDSDPDMDEALRRIRTRALKRLEIEAAYLERDHQLRSAVAHEIATGIAA
jgi:hypothetical protein